MNEGVPKLFFGFSRVSGERKRRRRRRRRRRKNGARAMTSKTRGERGTCVGPRDDQTHLGDTYLDDTYVCTNKQT